MLAKSLYVNIVTKPFCDSNEKMTQNGKLLIRLLKENAPHLL